MSGDAQPPVPDMAQRVAEAVLGPVARALRSPMGAAALHTAVTVARKVLAGYCRLEIRVDAPLPEGPAVVVSNHGFGGIVDLNVVALLEVLERHATRPYVILTHDLAWTLGAGPLVEAAHARPASRGEALCALAQGWQVALFPGGDLDAAKSFPHRNRVDFFGATGFARVDDA